MEPCSQGTRTRTHPVRRVSYRLPRDLRDRSREVIRKVKGPKGKSDWIREALAELVVVDPRLSRVGLGEALADHDVIDMVILDPASSEVLDQACLAVRRQDPLFQGVQSAVIRAALRYALERETDPYLEN